MSSSPSGHPYTRGSLLLLIAMVTSLSTVVTCQNSQFTFVNCSAASSPAPSLTSSSLINTTFWSNVVALLDALPSAASPKGFASLSQGSGIDRAFVRGLCRGDTTPVNCATYLRNAALSLRRSPCNSSRRAGIWYDDGSGGTVPAPMFCFVSYADTNTSTADEDAYQQPIQNRAEFSDYGDWTSYAAAMMSSLIARAVNGSTSPPMFATGKLTYDPHARNGTIYGLVQCMRDRTATECDKCLQDTMQLISSCCSQHLGGLVLTYNCYMRMEIYPFYDLSLDTPPAPPPPLLGPAPSSSVPSVQERPGKKKTDVTFAVALPVGTVLVVAILVSVFRHTRKDRRKIRRQESNEEDICYIEQDQLNLSVLVAATNNFAEDNKLGEGGFGEVFKGTLQDGQVIAVKRLSENSLQGFLELKNELVLVGKLKHRNLVQLMGVCLQEKLLVYEYMSNRSLDTVLFDPDRRLELDWSKRFMIIYGIARGLLYLHEESCLKVIHRDLKPSNVLLDAGMSPKISDFGLARAFVRDQSRDVTIRPVGTLGYMSPEYAYLGHVSTKSDMFSFGVIVLEVVTGRRSNSMSECPDYSTPLLSYVWGKWRTGSATDVVDASLGVRGQYPENEVLNCIEIGLLCVQENPEDRPDASTVVLMLDNPTTTSNGGRRVPSRPAFFFGSDNSTAGGHAQQTPSTASVSKNEVTISQFQPR